MSIALNVNAQFGRFSLTVSHTLPTNGIVGIFGHSGSGKSTLLRIICGLEKRVNGQIRFGENDLLNSSDNRFIKPSDRNIGLVFQDSRIFPHLSVKENLAFSSKHSKTRRIDFDEIVELAQLSPLIEANASQLSGGEQQRVALARAVLAEPELLLLDEPLSALDKHNKQLMLELITKVNQHYKIPIFYVSHSINELQQVADKLMVMDSGKVIDYGDIHQVIHRLNNNGLIEQQTSLSLKVTSHHQEDGLSYLTLDENQHIYLPLLPETIPSGELIRCYIYASDISITLDEPQNSSIVNHLNGTIENIEHQGDTVLVSVNCASTLFYTQISKFSFNKLALKPQSKVSIQFKAGAVRTLIGD